MITNTNTNTNTITHNQVFVMDAFLPAIRSASSHHYLGLTDRLELLTNTVFTVAKLLYAFVWQVGIFEAQTPSQFFHCD